MAQEQESLGAGHGHHSLEHNVHRVLEHLRDFDQRLGAMEKAIHLTRESQGRTEGSQGRDEGRTMEVLARLERIEKQMADLQGQLDAVGAKLDSVTNGFAAVIDSAVARIVQEIGKQGTVTPEIQAALDHLSGTADGLEALNAQSLDRISNAGAPVPVPPAPEPIPPAPEPVPSGMRGRR